MQLEINEELKRDYEEARFDLDSYSSTAVKNSAEKINKYVQSLELRLALLNESHQESKINNESLDKIVFHAKYGKQFEPEFKKEWFRDAITLWMKGYTFDGFFFRKGKFRIKWNEELTEETRTQKVG
jgi:hypothetical protein